MRNAQKSEGKAVEPAILLLEEYGALAAAIGSALKKFAPRHTTHVAQSLKELERLADEVRPELLIIDVDPPWPKLTQLLCKLRTENPEARALVIGATIPGELIENRGSRRALQFLDKPFDVAELGAAVQALLGPWKTPDTEELRGTLRSFGVVDAALLQCASGRTVVLEVKKNGGKTGELHFVDGQLLHVENGRRSGIEALEELFNWSQPEISEKEKRVRTSARRTIPAPWSDAFLEALQNTTPPEPPPEKAKVAVEDKPVARSAPAKTGKKIVVIDDTEFLLIFVEDILATSDPRLQITLAGSGAEGVRTVERVMPDLVLLDYSLPDLMGDEVCRRLLANERTASIPLLMMSGHVPEMKRTFAAYENVVATISKPFLSESLWELVEETLAHGPELRKARSEAPPQEPPAEVEFPSAPPFEPPKEQVSRRSQRTAPPRNQRTVAPPPSAPPVSTPPTTTPLSPTPDPRPVARPTAPPQPPAAPESPPVTRPTVPPRPQSPPPSAAAAPAFPVAAPKPPPPTISFEQPIPHVISVGPPPVQQIPMPGFTSIPASTRMVAPPVFNAPILTSGLNQVILGLFLEVVSMQLTPTFRMGTIRARPSSLTVSLHVASPALRAALPPNGFQLGPIDLDRRGQIAAIRVIPTVQPFMPLETRNSLQIGGVAVLPNNSHEMLQLTPSGQAPMRMHLLAPLELAGVELSTTFQISQLVLKSRGPHVRVTLNAQAVGQEQSGTTCETAGVQLDGAARLSELTLNPVG